MLKTQPDTNYLINALNHLRVTIENCEEFNSGLQDSPAFLQDLFETMRFLMAFAAELPVNWWVNPLAHPLDHAVVPTSEPDMDAPGQRGLSMN